MRRCQSCDSIDRPSLASDNRTVEIACMDNHTGEGQARCVSITAATTQHNRVTLTNLSVDILSCAVHEGPQESPREFLVELVTGAGEALSGPIVDRHNDYHRNGFAYTETDQLTDITSDSSSSLNFWKLSPRKRSINCCINRTPG
jgi:hypothetical protein